MASPPDQHAQSTAESTTGTKPLVDITKQDFPSAPREEVADEDSKVDSLPTVPQPKVASQAESTEFVQLPKPKSKTGIIVPQRVQTPVLQSQISRLRRMAYHYQRLSALHLEEAAELAAIEDANHATYVEQDQITEALAAVVD